MCSIYIIDLKNQNSSINGNIDGTREYYVEWSLLVGKS